MTTSTAAAELSAVDTNVLVYAVDARSPHHSACRALMERGRTGEGHLGVTAQALAEFYAVVTSPRRVERPVSGVQALATVEQILAMPGVSLLPIPADLVERLVRLARRYPVTGSGIFDLQMIATILGNGLRRVYTYNRQDFEAIEGIETVTP